MVEAQICPSLGKANLWILNSGVEEVCGRSNFVNCEALMDKINVNADINTWETKPRV